MDMTATVLQFDFPYNGPWGEEMAKALGGLAKDIADEPRLLWKLWTENREAGRAGGIYLFLDAASAEHYRSKHCARLEAFGISGIVAWSFDANPVLSAITRGPCQPVTPI
jgi:hypothetical protein